MGTKVLELDRELTASLKQACAQLGGHELAGLLARSGDGRLVLDDHALDVIRNYARRIQEHLDERYPGHDDEEEGYDPINEDLYLDAMDTYRNKLVMLVADQVGNDFLEKGANPWS